MQYHHHGQFVHSEGQFRVTSPSGMSLEGEINQENLQESRQALGEHVKICTDSNQRFGLYPGAVGWQHYLLYTPLITISRLQNVFQSREAAGYEGDIRQTLEHPTSPRVSSSLHNRTQP